MHRLVPAVRLITSGMPPVHAAAAVCCRKTCLLPPVPVLQAAMAQPSLKNSAPVSTWAACMRVEVDLHGLARLVL
eukprot:1148661-Pelagomonas_calceolata.AAC.3